MLEKYFKGLGPNPEGEVTKEDREKVQRTQGRLATEKPDNETEEEKFEREKRQAEEIIDPYGKEGSPLSRVLAGSRDPRDIEEVRKKMSSKHRAIFDAKASEKDD